MHDEAIRRQLQAAGAGLEVGVSLAPLTTIGCGGAADYLARVENEDTLARLLETADQLDLPWFVLGSGSNLLVADAGWQGLLIRLEGELATCNLRQHRLDCGGGAPLGQAVKAAVSAGLSGLERLEGIPGTVGGAVAMNAGAFGTNIGDRVLEVRVCLPGRTRVLAPADLEFGYRRAKLPPRAVVSRVSLQLAPANGEDPRAAAGRYRRRRLASQPRGRSFGSVFRNPGAGASAGELLEKAGCKGLERGGAAVSEQHANFIVNRGGASAADVIALINECRRRVLEQEGVLLEPEVVLLGDLELEPL